MRTALIVTLALVAGAVHLAYGSPAGSSAYLFVATLLLSFGIYSQGMRGQNYWLSLTGLVEAWFLFDYCFYGTAVSVLQRSKTPLPASMDEAYSRTYLVGALAFLAFALDPMPASPVRGPRIAYGAPYRHCSKPSAPGGTLYDPKSCNAACFSSSLPQAS